MSQKTSSDHSNTPLSGPPPPPSMLSHHDGRRQRLNGRMIPQHAYGTVDVQAGGDEDTPPLPLRKMSSHFSIVTVVAVVGLLAIAGGGSSSTAASSEQLGAAAAAAAAGHALLSVPQPDQAGKKHPNSKGRSTPHPTKPQANVTFTLHTDCVNNVKNHHAEFWTHTPIQRAYVVRHNFGSGAFFDFKDAENNLRMLRKESDVPGEHGVFELTTDQVDFEWGYALSREGGGQIPSSHIFVFHEKHQLTCLAVSFFVRFFFLLILLPRWPPSTATVVKNNVY